MSVSNCFWHCKEKKQIESRAIFLARFTTVSMGETEQQTFFHVPLLQRTMVTLKESRLLQAYKMIEKHQNTLGLSLLREHFVQANCSTLFLELIFFFKHLIGQFPWQLELNRLFTDFSTFLLNIFSLQLGLRLQLFHLFGCLCIISFCRDP